jgi:transposase, IS5 family
MPASVSAPNQRNRWDENDEVKAGKTRQNWEKTPAKNAQKDKDARWTYRKSFYGYKNHIGVDKSHKIRKWDVTDPSVHDSQKLEQLLDQTNTGKEVWADSAYARRRSRRGLRPRA